MPNGKKFKTDEEWANYYDWAVALLHSDPDLADLFERAKKKDYTRERFVAELHKTNWWKKNGENARQTIALKYSDPASWRQRVRAIYANVQALAGQMGVKTTWQHMWDIAEDALMMGWDNTQLRSALAKYLTAKDGVYGGEAQDAKTQLEQYAYQMGIRLDQSSLNGWLKGILNGSKTVSGYKAYLQKMAIQAFPTLADDIKGGLTVRDIASPYMQSMQSILEINGDALDLYDPTIRSALTNVNPETGKPELKPLWQFENDLRKDPRWLQTNNAREGLNGVAHQVLKDFGLAF